MNIGPHSYVHVVPFSVNRFVTSYLRVALVVCGFVGGGTTAGVVETELSASPAVTPSTEKAKRAIVAAVER